MVGGAGVRIAALLLALLVPAGWFGGAPRPAVSGPAPAPAGADTRTAVATQGGYQTLLDDTDTQLADAFAGIGAAPTQPALERAVLAAAGAVSAAGERLTGSGPVPAELAGGNTDLADSLHQFARELAYLSHRIHQRAICAGPTALRALGTAPSLPDLRAAARWLGTPRTDRPAFRWGDALPAPAEQEHRRLPNGSLPVDRRGPGEAAAGGPASPAGPAPGDGELRAGNDGGQDAVLLLARDGRILVALAVDAGSSATLTGVPDGDYDLYFYTGSDWDDTLLTFSRDCDFHRFTTPTSFRTTPVAGGSEYTVQDVQVHTPPADSGADTGDGPDGDGAPPDPAGTASGEPGTEPADPDRLPR